MLLADTAIDVVVLCAPEAYGLDLKDVDVPVIGGHAGTTILPLLSQASRLLPKPLTGPERQTHRCALSAGSCLVYLHIMTCGLDQNMWSKPSADTQPAFTHPTTC